MSNTNRLFVSNWIPVTFRISTIVHLLSCFILNMRQWGWSIASTGFATRAAKDPFLSISNSPSINVCAFDTSTIIYILIYWRCVAPLRSLSLLKPVEIFSDSKKSLKAPEKLLIHSKSRKIRFTRTWNVQRWCWQSVKIKTTIVMIRVYTILDSSYFWLNCVVREFPEQEVVDSPTYISFYCAIQWWFFLFWCGRRDPIRCYGWWWWGMYKVFIYDTTPFVLMVRLCRIRDRSRFAAATSPRFEMQEEAISKAGIN